MSVCSTCRGYGFARGGHCWTCNGSGSEPVEQDAFPDHARPAGEGEREAVARIVLEHVSGNDPDELIHHPWQKSWEEPSRPRWTQFEEAADAIIALLSPAAPDAGGGWMPIETAPKDGTEILLYSVPNEVPSLKPHIGSGSWRSSSSFMAPGLWVGTHPIGPSFCPTHWMPLPAPPALQPGGER